MAAFAALVSLMNTMHLIRNHPRYSFSFSINQIASLSENAQIFLEFVESFNRCHQTREDLEMQIAYLACLAENLLVSLTVHQIRAGSALDHGEDRSQISSSSSSNLQMKIKALEVPEEVRSMVDSDYVKDQVQKRSWFSSYLLRKKKVMKKKVEVQEKLPSTSDADCCNLFDLEKVIDRMIFDLEKVIDRMSCIVEEVMKVKNESTTREQQSTDFMAPAAASTRSPTTGNKSMVGFDRYLHRILDLLTGYQSTQKIISVVGMGGIGKTTLAKNVYDHLGIVHHFDIRAWVTVSQQFDTKEILLQLLGRKGKSTSEDLGEQLHKKLWGRRYLIILDDMWSSDVWDRIRFFFPDNDNGSRIVITSRISNVSSHLSSSSLEMELLDDNESWKLFCSSTFGEEECPVDLVEIGKNIVKKCKGLPLSIVVIGGHLKKASRMKEEWETVARNMMSFLDSGENQCLSILSLSYTHLPARLKPCFLYMGGFHEDKRIDVPNIIRFWVAEGFLQPDGSRSFEEIAESNLKDLVDRNLILVQEQGWNGKIVKCKVHDLVREVCLKAGRKERFFCVLKHGGGSSRCKHEQGFGGSEVCLAAEKRWQLDESRLVEELIADFVEFFDRRLESRYINCEDWSLPEQPRLPWSISLCWNLQTLFIHGTREKVLAPSEIWEMPWLRHLDVTPSIHLPDPPKRHLVMRSLHTLKVIENLALSEDVCGRISNIKELNIYYDHETSKMSSLQFCTNNLCSLEKLESLVLECSFGFKWLSFAKKLTYPSRLQVLKLVDLRLYWEDLSMIGSLLHLQVLTLIEANSVKGKEWSPIQGQYLNLRSLKIDNCGDLVHWNAESSHFPMLESITLVNAHRLMEFPSDIGEIPTLRHVKLTRCSMSAAISAIRMFLEQTELGNEDLRLEILLKYKDELERVKEMVQEEGIESNNLFLEYCPY